MEQVPPGKASKVLIFYLSLYKNIYCGYPLEAYPQYMFLFRNKKNINFI